jgi:hypothetical protein
MVLKRFNIVWLFNGKQKAYGSVHAKHRMVFQRAKSGMVFARPKHRVVLKGLKIAWFFNWSNIVRFFNGPKAIWF